MSRPPRPPAHLSAASRKWWASVVQSWALEPHHMHLLSVAAEALDRLAQARAAILKDGPVFRDRFGQPREHPACAVERGAAITFMRALRELDLDLAPPPPAESPRPPRIGRQ